MRAARLTWVQLRASLVTTMQYRSNFLIQGLMSMFWLLVTLVPLLVLFEERGSVAGWSFESSLVVMGWFVVLRGVLEGAINPSLVDLVDRIRTGSFDYVLLKPADSQLLVSTSRFEPWKVVDVLGGLALITLAMYRRNTLPSAADVASATALLLCGLAVLYSLWFLVVSAAFWVVRLDNLTYLFSAIFDAARWPVQVFRGFWRVLFTVVIPLAIMTTYPAMALLGTLEISMALEALVLAVVLASISRLVWSFAVRNYTSASS